MYARTEKNVCRCFYKCLHVTGVLAHVCVSQLPVIKEWLKAISISIATERTRLFISTSMREIKQESGSLTCSIQGLVCLWASEIHEGKPFPVRLLMVYVPKDFYFNPGLNCPSGSKLIVFAAKRPVPLKAARGSHQPMHLLQMASLPSAERSAGKMCLTKAIHYGPISVRITTRVFNLIS